MAEEGSVAVKGEGSVAMKGEGSVAVKDWRSDTDSDKEKRATNTWTGLG